MASPTLWTWVWASSGSWWWTGKPGRLSPRGCRESDTTEQLNWTELRAIQQRIEDHPHNWPWLSLSFFFFIYRPFLKSLLNLLWHFFCFTFWFFGPEACGILSPQLGIEPRPPALLGKVLITGPPGKSWPWLSQGNLIQRTFQCPLQLRCISLVWSRWVFACMHFPRELTNWNSHNFAWAFSSQRYWKRGRGKIS